MIPIYDRAKLSKQFIDYIKNVGVPDYMLPLWTDQGGYRFDWNIIGGEEAREMFEPYYYIEHGFSEKNNLFTLDQQFAVFKWLNRISNKIFMPHKMIRSSVKTDAVQLRIASSLLNKMELPMHDKWMLHDNMTYTYWVRKNAYDIFFCNEVMQFPFAPDFHFASSVDAF